MYLTNGRLRIKASLFPAVEQYADAVRGFLRSIGRDIPPQAATITYITQELKKLYQRFAPKIRGEEGNDVGVVMVAIVIMVLDRFSRPLGRKLPIESSIAAIDHFMGEFRSNPQGYIEKLKRNDRHRLAGYV